MTFNNLCALYENACLDYEVSTLTEGADSEEAKTAEAKKIGLASKIFASIGAAFEKLGQMIMRVLTFIKRRFVRDKVKLARDTSITPASAYKKFLSDIINYSLAVDDEGNEKKFKYGSNVSPVKFADTLYVSGTVIDKTSYQEVLEKAKRLTSKYEQLKNKAVDIKEKYLFVSKQKFEYASVDATAYSSILKALSSITTHIDSDMKEISKNAAPEDVAPVNDKKEKADTNNESAMFGGLTRNELRAQLLIEAADLLNEGAATEARKEIIGDIKLKRKTELYKNFIDNKMDYNEAKKYYATIKKEIALLKTKLKNFPEETTVERIMSTFAPFILTGVIGGAVVIGLRGQEGTFSSILKAVGLTYAIMSIVFGIPIAAIEYNAKDEQGKKINFNKYKVETKLARLEEDIDETMFLYDSRNKQYKE